MTIASSLKVFSSVNWISNSKIQCTSCIHCYTTWCTSPFFFLFGSLLIMYTMKLYLLVPVKKKEEHTIKRKKRKKKEKIEMWLSLNPLIYYAQLHFLSDHYNNFFLLFFFFPFFLFLFFFFLSSCR